MQNTTPHSFARYAAPKLSLREVETWAEDWLLVAEQRRQTEHTRQQKREIIAKIAWFLRHRGFDECGLPELRRLFVYLDNGHFEAGGRWGNPGYTTPMRPVWMATYYVYLKGYWTWLVPRGSTPGLAVSPLGCARRSHRSGATVHA